MSKYKLNQTVYMIASNRIVQPVVVKKTDDNQYLVGFERSGEMQVSESRLFASMEDANEALGEINFQQPKVLTFIDKVRR